MKNETPEFIEESSVNSPRDLEKGNISFAFVRKKDEHPDLVHHFSAGIERQRHEEKEPEHDILTPALKVVHPSAASLHHFYTFPLLTIEEEDAFCSSQSSTIVESASSSIVRPSILKFVFITLNISKPLQHFCKIFLLLYDGTVFRSSEETSLFKIPEDDEVAQAVAYLRRRSVSAEQANCDNEKDINEK